MSGQRWTMDDIREKGLKVIDTTKPINKAGKIIPNNIPASFALGRMKAGKMNKTELQYAARLEALKQAGEVLWYEFEPLNLRLADKCFYSVDFLVMLKNGQLECHEVKGGYITDDSLVKFKLAAQKFPFKFRMFMLKKREWMEKYSI